MKHIVFLVGSYHPNFSAVGYCAYQVQKCLSEQYKVSVIAMRSELSSPSEEFYEGANLYRIETRHQRLRAKLRANKTLLAKFGSSILRASGILKRLFSPQTVDQSLVKAYREQLEKLPHKPDVIIPLVFPFETVLASLSFKKPCPNTVVFPYIFDDFVESGSLHVLRLARWFKRSRHLKLEQLMLENSDAVLAMHPLKKHFDENFDVFSRAKIQYLEHPLLTEPKIPNATIGDGTIRLCFTGSLIKNVREPEYLLRLLKNIDLPKSLQADFYVMGNYAHKVKSINCNNIQIVNHGKVPKNFADIAIGSADILVNLGERHGRQVSSKIFEYMATGKPIVHLACVEDDVVSQILMKYPLALCLIQKTSELQNNSEKLAAFITKKQSQQIDYDLVAEIYPEALPQTTAQFISLMINKSDH